ncbi:hypothetical protein PG999_006449 [Apiospora kogelbergensis]|uniref:DUF7704 domain-containing protein n=1 Tax=Apiospora kogelbergensis TaxID=1337665 RepID=A0AAW0QQK2_9PEZI
MARTKSTAAHTLPLPYRLFFLVIEPISALVGAYYAHFRKADYLALTHPPTAPPSNAIPAGTSIVLSQLANLYLLFALNEALVLRSTSDFRRAGGRVYWDVASWNAIDWGNVPFVYLGASMRLAFLLGVGLGGPRPVKNATAARKSA